ncbi:MAG TPA: STELLO glycosyltransferase family protein [Bacteroidales bacterium]
MQNTFLIVTSIANQEHPVLKILAEESLANDVSFIIIGDTKSPETFSIKNGDFYSIERQQSLSFHLVANLPYKHYARKNLGYLIAMSKGAEILIETDDDNIPLPGFWESRSRKVKAHLLKGKGWVNIYGYFTDVNIWPRGFALEKIQDKLPVLEEMITLDCPIQQGLADENPDVDAIYRLIMPLPVYFNQSPPIALGENSICPFNSQNTTWFKEAFPLLYLPSHCSFRMTDIWRSFVAQRIAWTCGWSVLFHHSTVRQERNDHNLMKDFQDEICGYNQNLQIGESLKDLNLKTGVENIPENMITSYQKLIDLGVVGAAEMNLLKCWLKDIEQIKNDLHE